MTTTELFVALLNSMKERNFKELKWPNEGMFEVVVGAVLVQNTNWRNVEKALENLKNAGKMSLSAICELDTPSLANLIKPSGFYNTKAKRLRALCLAMRDSFDDFENFKENASRGWLLGVKGVGAETCDAILAYACGRAVMVVDAYVLRILDFLGYGFDSYDEAQEWLSGLEYSKIYEILDDEIYDEVEILKLYHILVLEFCKQNFKGKILSERGRAILGEAG
ncbi:endonuclease III domain-containing protein [Campylobacter curvus]|uniref:endonuclease III domain-containing protein n=1 Tax=Campylobacter curvus TaxID=200 RepID=UPI0014706A02|nr:endonuclease III [Campylobacter curvus]